jgi:hypothetical protein
MGTGLNPRTETERRPVPPAVAGFCCRPTGKAWRTRSVQHPRPALSAQTTQTQDINPWAA